MRVEDTLPAPNKSHLKIDGWMMKLYGLFSGVNCFRRWIHFFLIFTPGEMIQFDDHIFQWVVQPPPSVGFRECMQHGFISGARRFVGEEKDAASRGRNAAERARQYMEESGIQPFLQDLGFL